MATSYKTFLDDDIVNSRTLLHENIPLTSSVINGVLYDSENIKQFTHGIFETIYDYPYESSSANQLFDMTAGITPVSPCSSSEDLFVGKKINMYNQMAQVLVGYDSTGSVYMFDNDGDQTSGFIQDKFHSVFFLNFSRLLVKDEIKKGSFKLTLGIGSNPNNPFETTCVVADSGSSAAGGYKINSPTGEYAVLTAGNFSGNRSSTQTDDVVGLVFYQAGVAVISTSIFAASASQSVLVSAAENEKGLLETAIPMDVHANIQELFSVATIEEINFAFRSRIGNIAFNNTTELNSTIHLCRVGHNDFNYSSNPTYLNESKIRVKNKSTDAPLSFITTIGLFSPDNELLAVAKLSQPIQKDPSTELLLRVRLDY